MGNFDTAARSASAYDVSRGASGQEKLSEAKILSRNLRIISQSLSKAGLLNKGACPTMTRAIILSALKNFQTSLLKTENISTISVKDGEEKSLGEILDKAIKLDRLKLSHRIIAESNSPREPGKLISGGMKRALLKLEQNGSTGSRHGAAYRRALLPSVSIHTFQSNRRLAEAMSNGAQIPDLENVFAETISENGKQGYSDVKDFFSALTHLCPETARGFAEKVQFQLDGIALRRFRKLLFNQPPVESDFIESSKN